MASRTPPPSNWQLEKKVGVTQIVAALLLMTGLVSWFYSQDKKMTLLTQQVAQVDQQLVRLEANEKSRGAKQDAEMDKIEIKIERLFLQAKTHLCKP